MTFHAPLSSRRDYLGGTVSALIQHVATSLPAFRKDLVPDRDFQALNSGGHVHSKGEMPEAFANQHQVVKERQEQQQQQQEQQQQGGTQPHTEQQQQQVAPGAVTAVAQEELVVAPRDGLPIAEALAESVSHEAREEDSGRSCTCTAPDPQVPTPDCPSAADGNTDGNTPRYARTSHCSGA